MLIPAYLIRRTKTGVNLRQHTGRQHIFTQLLNSVDACILRNVVFASLAIAFAKIVFPHPGGPYNSILFSSVY